MRGGDRARRFRALTDNFIRRCAVLRRVDVLGIDNTLDAGYNLISVAVSATTHLITRSFEPEIKPQVVLAVYLQCHARETGSDTGSNLCTLDIRGREAILPSDPYGISAHLDIFSHRSSAPETDILPGNDDMTSRWNQTAYHITPLDWDQQLPVCTLTVD